MAKDGDYPFFVNVWNRFEEGSNVKLEVVFYHYYNGENPGPIENREPPEEPDHSYSISPGDMIAFPLYWAETNDSSEYIGEYLEITLRNPPTEAYYVWLGPKADYNEDLSHIPGVKKIPSGTGGKNSGLYEVPANNNTWMITVRKLIHDPESDSVSVGPDIP
jgi:hypothetical protein